MDKKMLYSKVASTKRHEIRYRKTLLVPVGEYKQYEGFVTEDKYVSDLESDILKNDESMKNSKIKEGYESYHEISSPLN